MKNRSFSVSITFFASLLLWCSILPKIPSLAQLSLDEKIGQLITIAAVSSVERNHEFMQASPYHMEPSYVEELITTYHIGGVIFLGAGVPDEQAAMTQRLQSLSRYPLFIALDAEWGLSMRLQKDVITYPRAMTLGALAPEHDHLIYELGRLVGRQCKALGVHLNCAPVADVNNNPHNPVINTRSFGDSPERVACKASLYMRGMQDEGILACGKHFPGHGDTATDSHRGRCTIPHTLERLMQVELVPFKQLIHDNVGAIMTGHLDVPALEQNESVPATLSHSILTKLLREQLQFNGLIISDGLGMQGVVNDFSPDFAPGELELKAVKAGIDILLCPVNVSKTVERIKDAVAAGELTEEELDQHVVRILAAKKAVIPTQPLAYKKSELVNPPAQELKKKLYRAAVTLVHDRDHRIPFALDTPLRVISFGANSSPFIQELQKKGTVEHTAYSLNTPSEVLDTYEYKKEDHLIISLHIESRSGMIEMAQETTQIKEPLYISFIKRHADHVTLVLFGNPYNSIHFTDTSALIIGYENDAEAQRAVADTLRGLSRPEGKLPVTVSPI